MVGEEQKGQGTPSGNPTSNNGARSQSETTSVIESAHLAAERLEKANKEAREIAERMERAATVRIMGGKSEAGQVPEMTADQKLQAEAQAIVDRRRGIKR